jgi:hypothetical protein
LTGIIEYPTEAYSSMGYIITNAWQEKVDGSYVLVFAGASAKDPHQGLLLVETDDRSQSGIFYSPEKKGLLRIVKVAGFRLVLETPNKDIFYFDVPGRRFVDSMEEVVPTATPRPKLLATATPVSPYP